MKPLLIIPPAPQRWPALQDLYTPHLGAAWLSNMEQRLRHGVAGAEDAYAIIGAGGNVLAAAHINTLGDVGLMGPVFTRPEHRGRGLARAVVQSVLSWFDMTGGKWLLAQTTRALDEALFRKIDFRELRCAAWEPFDRITLIRTGPSVTGEPEADATLPLAIRPLSRRDWPEMVTFLQYFEGPDPRVPLGESAVTAELLTLDMLGHLERGTCELLGAVRGPRLVGLATLATDQPGKRSYAILMPHSAPPPELREAIVSMATQKGYEHVDFPMESLPRASL